jgi:hypothetical protein
MGSKNLENVLEFVLPTPTRFRQVWNQQLGKKHFYAWYPISPSPQFVAMGMVGTTTEDPPPLNSVRCVPKVSP